MFGKNDTTPYSISTGTMVRACLVLLGFFLVWYLSELVLVLFTSIVVASFVESAIPHFHKFRLNRIWGIILLYITFLLVISALFYLFAPLLITEVYNFSTFLSSYIPGISFIDYFKSDAFAGAKDVVANLPQNLSVSSLLIVSKAFILNLSGGFFQTLSAAFGSVFNVGLIILISFYLAIQEKGIETFLRIILPLSVEDYVVDLWNRSSRKIGLWVRGQVLLGILVGILTYLVLSLLGIKYALLLSLVAGIMELVPYGILVALVPAVAFSYLDGGVSSALMVAGAYLIIHQFEVFLFAP
ncbi:MAG: AI-2E family transporter, partial [Candidatus Paceibacterota bacterium]